VAGPSGEGLGLTANLAAALRFGWRAPDSLAVAAGTVLGVTWSSRYGDEMSVDGGISGSRTAESPDHWAVVPKRCRHLERSGDYLSYAGMATVLRGRAS